MQKFVRYIFVLFFVACIAACGGGGTTAATVVYDHPTTLAPSNTHMGGAVQGTPLGLGNPVTVSSLAGTTNGPPAMFNHPTDVTTDGTNFYVTDYLNNLIRKITSSGVVTTLQCTDAVTGVAIGFNRPTGVTIKADGSQLYVVDSGSNTIRIIDIDSTTNTNKVTIIGSSTGLAGSFDSITDKTAVLFNQPTGITTDGVNLYVTDTGNQSVRRIVIAGFAVTTLAGTSGAIGSTDGIQGAASFNLPNRITTDGVNLYLTDLNNKAIRKIDILTGTVTTIAGSPGPVGTADGVGTAARFNQASGITTDGKILYVTDSYENTIRMIDKSAPYNVTTVPMPAGSLHAPIGITTDGVSLFVADTYILNVDDTITYSNSILKIK